jgi:hypothetical protein
VIDDLVGSTTVTTSETGSDGTEVSSTITKVVDLIVTTLTLFGTSDEWTIIGFDGITEAAGNLTVSVDVTTVSAFETGFNDEAGTVDGTLLLATITLVVDWIGITVTPAGTSDDLTITGLAGNEDFGGAGKVC